ncbi:MAG: hypothetical protein ACKO1K_08915, partial [Burkholderiales bacterium]
MNHDFMAALTGAESLLPDYRHAPHPWQGYFLWLALLLTSLHYVSFPARASNTASAAAVVMVYGDSLSAAYGIKPE